MSAVYSIFMFVVGHRYDTCPVCLEDFVEKDKLWILPCDHGMFYHSFEMKGGK